MNKFENDQIKEDKLYPIVKGVLGSIPIVGAAMTTAFELVFITPLNKRKNKWIERLSETVNVLLEKVENLDVEKLSQNDSFISACNYASQIAVRTHQNEKLEALQNALFNIALKQDDDYNLQSLHLRLIDELTPLHVKMLAFQQNPIIQYKLLKKKSGKIDNLKTLKELWNIIVPKYPVNSGPAIITARDLYLRGLSRHENLDVEIKKITTKLGDEFLGYIQKPNFK